jgi:Zinc finger, C2H2 type
MLAQRNKDLIAHHAYNNIADLDGFAHHLQDGQLPPDLLHAAEQPSFYLESPFQSPRYSFLPDSGSSSPTFSSTHSPATANLDYSSVFDGAALPEAPSMSVASSYNPSFHIPHSAPSPYPSYYNTPQFVTPMLAQPGITASWDTDNVQLLSPAHAHARAASGSSGKTGGSSSPHAAAAAFAAGQYQNPKKSLPTPVQTPIQNSFLAPAFQNYDPSAHNGDTVAADQAMRQAVMEQQHTTTGNKAEDDTFHYSLAPSVSSLSHQNSPVTPQQTAYDEFDDGSKALVHGEECLSSELDRWMGDYLQVDALDYNSQGAMSLTGGVPKFNRTISDIYQDELYNAVVPTSSTSSSQMRKQNSNANANQQLLNAPYRNLFADRLNAATQGHLSARSQSPVGNSMNRERSPFRQGSPLAADFRQQHVRLQAASGLGSALLPEGLPQDNQGQVKTISPKDALLEYHEGPDDGHGLPSLFPSNDLSLAGSAMTSRRQSATSAFQQQQQPTLPFTQMEAFPTQYPGLQQNFIPQQPAAAFPASLPTMESTTTSDGSAVETKRPSDTSSDSGTYTCTYHGCTLRFETPSKLQKHKREAHRQTMTGAPAAEPTTSLALRNSQAGPHKCERINPSTGKPCNSIFSRPYDLTRHEDTIHNARKQKVRCHLCTEEKTFSRNDALTRHMRVVHPEVDWPGKQRRKGRD